MSARYCSSFSRSAPRRETYWTNINGSYRSRRYREIGPVKHYYENLQIKKCSLKMALSAVAATVVGSTTLHWWGGLPTRISGSSNNWMDRKSTTKDLKARREKNIVDTLWLAINEISIMTAEMLTHTSQVMGFVKTGTGQIASSVLFSGINIILLGDFHQFPPIANPRAALYLSPSSLDFDPAARVMGRNMYSQFEMVVTLTEQMCITDKDWMQILERAQMGDCTSSDLQEIRKLILGVIYLILICRCGTMLYLLCPRT